MEAERSYVEISNEEFCNKLNECSGISIQDNINLDVNNIFSVFQIGDDTDNVCTIDCMDGEGGGYSYELKAPILYNEEWKVYRAFDVESSDFVDIQLFKQF